MACSDQDTASLVTASALRPASPQGRAAALEASVDHQQHCWSLSEPGAACDCNKLTSYPASLAGYPAITRKDMDFDTTWDKHSGGPMKGTHPESNWLVRGRLLCGACPDTDDLGPFDTVTHFVSLTDGDDYAKATDKRFASASKQQGMRPKPKYHQYLLPEFATPPEALALEITQQVMAILRERGTTVYLHCRAG